MVSGNASTSPDHEPRATRDAASAPAEPPQTRLIPRNPADEPVACTVHAAPPPMERRGFLVWLASALLALGGLFMGATVVQALMPPARSIDGKTKVGTVGIANLSNLKVGEPVLVDYGDDVLFIIKKSPSSAVVLSQSCPHVGCKLHFNAASRQFDCPCHSSHFNIDGKKLGGPAPRDMIPAIYEVKNGEVVVSGISA